LAGNESGQQDSEAADLTDDECGHPCTQAGIGVFELVGGLAPDAVRDVGGDLSPAANTVIVVSIPRDAFVIGWTVPPPAFITHVN
jgi:hypothetical protein